MVPQELDVRKITKYPPEIFLQALPLDLAKGDNKVADYTGFSPYIISLYGVSFARYDGLAFEVGADGAAGVVSFNNLGAVKGLDYEEEVKTPARRVMDMKITAPSPITAYQLRHKIKVDEPNVLLKMQLDISLNARERELAHKYGLAEKLMVQRPAPFDPYTFVEPIYTVAKVMTESGTIFRLPVPMGMKAVLLDLSTYRPATSATGYVIVERDDVDNVVRVDPYCMQGLERSIGLWPRYTMRIVALDNLLLKLDWTSGTHRIRATYGLGRVTIPEKIRWGVDLTDEEEAKAEELDLFNKVDAGLL